MFLPVGFNLDVQMDDLKAQAQTVLQWTFGIVYYPLWFLCAFVYGLNPYALGPIEDIAGPIWDYCTSITGFTAKKDDDSTTNLQALLTGKKDDAANGLMKSAKVPGRDKAIQSVLKIAGLDKQFISEVINEENDTFAEELKFTDHIVSYSNRKEWITSFHALTSIMSSKIVESETIRDEKDLSVVNVKMCWMSPFEFINEKVGGFEFSNVMVIRFDESNRVCQIDEFWNGRDHLDGMGVFGIMRKVTGIVTLPILQIISCFAKKGEQTKDTKEIPEEKALHEE